MEKYWPIAIVVGVIVSTLIYLIKRKSKGSGEDPAALDEARIQSEDDEIALDEYLNRDLSPADIGTRYERYIGHLYEMKGYEVKYNGAIKGFEDLGRDLIVKKGKSVLIVQTKCWGKDKLIHEKYVFQLYGSMAHFKATSNIKGLDVKAVFYTSSASYTGLAIEVAQDLGVDLKTQKLNNSFPMVKCKTSTSGEKTYHLPFDSNYDQLKVDPNKGEFFTSSVLEAFEMGFRRPQERESAA